MKTSNLHKTKDRFNIDFFELCFLAEACIPPHPIARSMFWDRLINEIYYDLTDGERENMFTWMQREPSFNLDKEGCQWFYARFNPKNQFTVSCFHKGVASKHVCFQKDDKFWTSQISFVDKDYIKSVVKINK